MNPSELAAQLSPGRFGKSKIELLQSLVLIGEAAVKRRTPVRKGTLRRSITGRIITPGVLGAVGTNLSYGQSVHDGTRAHVITARSKKALYWAGAAHPVRSVMHPGSKAQPFLTDGLNDARPEMERAAAAAGESFFASIS